LDVGQIINRSGRGCNQEMINWTKLKQQSESMSGGIKEYRFGPIFISYGVGGYCNLGQNIASVLTWKIMWSEEECTNCNLYEAFDIGATDWMYLNCSRDNTRYI